MESNPAVPTTAGVVAAGATVNGAFPFVPAPFAAPWAQRWERWGRCNHIAVQSKGNNGVGNVFARSLGLLLSPSATPYVQTHESNFVISSGHDN